MRQLLAIAKAVENHGNISQAMLSAGYPPATAKNPKNLTESNAWHDLMDEKLKDDKLLDVLIEGLDAGRDVYEKNNETGEVEMIGHAPDYVARHKYLETGLKLKGRLKGDGTGNLLAVQVNVRSDRQDFS